MDTFRTTHSNPVLDGDFSDPDVIRVGTDYWMITSSIHHSPGMTVLHSHDLVTWSYVSHCVPDLRLLGPGYSADEMMRSGRGVYAGSIRYHDGRYWVYFTTLDDGFFVTTAEHPAGPWSPVHRLWDGYHWDDPCPFWDDDGRAWLLASRPGESEWFTYIFPMSPDGLSIEIENRRVLNNWHTSEGNKIFRHDGRYYVLSNEVHGTGTRVLCVLRSDSIDGPWQKRILLDSPRIDREREPNQGALVDNADGSWSLLTHHGREGYADGRPTSLAPVTWADGWPTIVIEDGRTIPAEVVAVTDGVPRELARDDDFAGPALGSQWQWNHQPHDGAHTFVRGGLRIAGRRSVRPDEGLTAAPNTLLQRLTSCAAEISVHIDARDLAEGASAGLGHLDASPGAILVRRVDEVLRLEVGGPSAFHDSPTIDGVVTLHLSIDDRGYTSFAYSAADGRRISLGGSSRLSFAHYRGSRVALYSFAVADEGGGAVFSEFRHRTAASDATSRR